MGWISAIASLAGAAAGGIGSIVTNKRMESEAARQHGATNAMLYEQLYQDPTKRADYAAMMGQMQRQLKAQQGVLDAKNKITGGTDEALDAQRAAQAGVIGDVNEQAMSQQAKRRDAVQNQVLTEKQRYDNVKSDFLTQQMQNWGNLMSNAAGAFAGFEKSSNGGVGVKGVTPDVTSPDTALKAMEANKNGFISGKKITIPRF